MTKEIEIQEIEDPNEIYQDKYFQAYLLAKAYGDAIKNHPRKSEKKGFAQTIVEWSQQREDR